MLLLLLLLLLPLFLLLADALANIAVAIASGLIEDKKIPNQDIIMMCLLVFHKTCALYLRTRMSLRPASWACCDLNKQLPRGGRCHRGRMLNVECWGIQRDVYLSKTGAQLASTEQASGHTRGRPNGQVNNKHSVNEYIHRNQPTSQFSMESLPWPSINPSKLSGVTIITVITRLNMHAITISRCMSFVLLHFRTCIFCVEQSKQCQVKVVIPGAVL